MAAKDDVITTCFTLGAFFLIALRIPVVPMMAGSKRSFLISVTLKWNYRTQNQFSKLTHECCENKGNEKFEAN